MDRSVYIADIHHGIDRILSSLNRDICSDSCGSFDRSYWGWKKKDFPDTTLAFAYHPLRTALSISPRRHDKRFVYEIVLENIAKSIHADGSIDQVFPFDHQPKTALDIGDTLYDMYKDFGDDEVLRLYEKLIRYTLKREEDYAVICNHYAHFVYEYLLAFDCLGDAIYYKKAVSYLGLLEKNTDSEGWHREYRGADPGYQTRALSYLTKSLALLKSSEKDRCIDLCSRSAEFLKRVFLPDGTIYSMMGCRNTALVYPAGIECMANADSSQYSELAERVRGSIDHGVALHPLHLDFDNFIRLFDSYLDAYTVAENRPEKAASPTGVVAPIRLPNYGFRSYHQDNTDVFCQLKYGGTIAVFRNQAPVYRNAGYLLQKNSGTWYGSRNIGRLANTLHEDEHGFRIRTSLFPASHRDLTPGRLIVLRSLNLTVLRNELFARLFRRLLIGFVVNGKQDRSAGQFERSVQVDTSRLVIEDTFRLRFIPKRVVRSSVLNLFHMASSRYYEPGYTPQRWNEPIDVPDSTEFCFRYEVAFENAE